MIAATIIARAVAIARLCQATLPKATSPEHEAILDARVEFAWRTVRRNRGLS